MKVSIKKWGNSAGMLVPSALMNELELQVGQEMDMQVIDGALVIKPVKRRYSLQQLLDGCDSEAPAAADGNWENMPPAGKEVW
ncbi:antitoxin ChpS [Serratia marcescens]|uniref:Antitoxin ChpS n=1 Tax=Serratia marcescens TaxID=615 RepID=A0A1Q4NZW9_SERMA|nr:AbrB/MazE/SpoVT family DNA-binding domain-containing protein [Serratia marcescens]OKB66436.1 antitoxin ChpS [Serratia marcescens]